MKKGIFNKYLKYVCKGLDIDRSEFFEKNREVKIAQARWILYSMCYQRPMTIMQIVDLMAENGYVTSRQNIENGISKISDNQDPDVRQFIDEGLELFNHHAI